MPQVTFRALAEPRIRHASSHGPPAQLGSTHYPLLSHFCLFVHIPIPDPVPPHISSFQYSFCFMFLLHPKSIPRLAELGYRTMGCRTSASPLIRSVRHHDYSVHPSVHEFRFPYVSCFRSSFCFMFPFLFAISVPFYF